MSAASEPCAFPLPAMYTPTGEPIWPAEFGMTLHTYIFVHALQGMLANPASINAHRLDVVEQAARVADASMEFVMAREKRQ